KVRGLRVDLGDIETVLRQHPAVKEAVVVDKEFSTGDQRLVAYWVPGLQNEPPTQGRVEIDSLRIFLKEKIPPYMVPNVFVMLEKLPLSPNGKLDRDALPEPEASRSGMKEIELPRTPIEKEIVTIFAEILKLEQLGINDNFFESGGHSLMVTQVISRVNEIFQVQLSQMDLLVDPTVAGLAKRIETVRSKEKVAL
ncbi:MAG: non-ribosomal peptide synthetase, partial [Candidatus Aminicenantes bacterium]